MSIALNLVGAEEFYNLSRDGVRRELLEGHVHIMSPATPKHSWIGGKLFRILGNFVEAKALGETFDATAGYLVARNPDTVLEPDGSFVTSKRVGAVFRDRGFAPAAPDLVFEIISPSQTRKEQMEKGRRWIDAGCEVVWIVDPEVNQIVVFDGDAVSVLSEGQELKSPILLPGFTLKLEELFLMPK